MTQPSIVWLRRDLRLADQPALHAAARQGPVVCVYVLDDETAKHRAMGGASRWWLHHSLADLAQRLEQIGSRLILRRGQCEEQLAQVAQEIGAKTVHAIRHYEPWWRNAERAVGKVLDLVCHDGNFLLPPGTVLTGAGQPYKIYTPFSRALLEHYQPGDPLPVPILTAPPAWPASDRLADWNLLPAAPDWAAGIAAAWDVGEQAAQDRLDWWVGEVSAYATGRNLPSQDLTSRLSPHLHFGEISPLQVWRALDQCRGEGADIFRKELIWRDYAQNVICQFPDYGQASYRAEFAQLAWRDPPTDEQARADLAAWQQGRTGYPIVDAGMRQLWHTGWMHNRVRMIAASFLVKHLLIDWRNGERWFWDTLVDADYAANAVNWQWTAGSGVDANMFVRIMAPLTQSRKFDAGAYIREWVPELAALPDVEIHDPAPLRRHGYPPMIVGHREGRERALAAYREAKG
ncbi:MAG: deoxyribodipyrimidine photo-lyase [Croceibacterium sp.]